MHTLHPPSGSVCAYVPRALVRCKELAALNVCIHVLLAVKYIIPQTRSVPLISDSASGASCAQAHTDAQWPVFAGHGRLMHAFAHMHRKTAGSSS